MAAHTGCPRGLAVALGPSITPQVESTARPSCHRAGVLLSPFQSGGLGVVPAKKQLRPDEVNTNGSIFS